jgi:hypothetical protein
MGFISVGEPRDKPTPTTPPRFCSQRFVESEASAVIARGGQRWLQFRRDKLTASSGGKRMRVNSATLAVMAVIMLIVAVPMFVSGNSRGGVFFSGLAVLGGVVSLALRRR